MGRFDWCKGVTMELRWNLDDLYKSFSSEAFSSDMAAMDEAISTFGTWTETAFGDQSDAATKIETYIQKTIELGHLLQRLGAFASLSLAVETTNDTAQQNLERMQQKHTSLTKPTVTFKKWLAALSDLDSLIESSVLLQEHHFFLQETLKEASHLLSDEEEIVISTMKNTGSKAWGKLQNLITSTLPVSITMDGEKTEKPLSMVRNLYYDPDGSKRRAAYDAELAALPVIERTSAACLNAIKGEVIELSKMRGFSSPLDETLEHSRMDRKTLDAMMEAVHEFLPVMRRFYRCKAELLGHTGGLPFYDIFAPMGSGGRTFSYDDAREFIVSHFGSFSHNLSSFADHAFSHQWIDAEPRSGKRGGAFCSNLHCIGQSRILANFNGSFDNVRTIAHELGHGYHGACLKNASLLNARYPMPLAETASILCESIVTEAALSMVSSEEAFSILETDLSSSGQVITDIFSRYTFESRLFENRIDASVSVEELKTFMLDSQKEAYGDGLDHEFLHPYLWIVKPHYYSGDLSFYNFPYTFGLLFAKGLYARYREMGSSFVAAYDDLLVATGKNSVVDVAALMDIDVHDTAFWRGSLSFIGQDIDRFVTLANQRDSGH